VPTRWAITAVDKIVSDFLVDKIKGFREVDGYYLYVRRVYNNLFLAILAPSRWAYEWGEAFEPGTTWNPGPGLAIETDYELYRGGGSIQKSAAVTTRRGSPLLRPSTECGARRRPSCGGRCTVASPRRWASGGCGRT